MKQYLFVIAGIITVVILMAAGGQISPPYSGGAGAVASVFGRTGVITAVVGDYSAFFPTSVYCGLTNTCANTASSVAKIVRGAAPALPGSGANQVTITLSAASAFSDTTYECALTSHTNAPAASTIFTLNKQNGTQFIIAGFPIASTDIVGYVCTGN